MQMTDTEPDAETRFRHDQRYQRIGERPYQCADGRMTTLIEWRSNCAKCGAEFTCATSKASAIFEPNRRCQLHHRPGSKARQASKAEYNHK